MHLYNTRTRKVEPFPLSAQPITIYVCGITPYDTTHLGHAFTYVVNDTIPSYTGCGQCNGCPRKESLMF